MAVFDRHLEGVRAFSESLRERGRACKEIDCLALPSKPWAKADGGRDRSTVILRGDTFVELGNPTAGSCSALLWTDDPSRVRDGRMTLFGPDISESEGASLPFGQVLMLAGAGLTELDHERLQQAPIVGNRIDGYMVRSAAENIWSRVSKRAAGRGFDFATLGRALVAMVKSSTPGISAMELLFVTSSKQDVVELGGIAADAKGAGSELLKDVWKQRGYDVDCDFDCSSCHDEAVCTDLREVLGDFRKKMRDKTAGAARGGS